ncbi:MAG: polysaccharide deacetylase family protein [Candidatus Acidiferrales bacterium]
MSPDSGTQISNSPEVVSPPTSSTVRPESGSDTIQRIGGVRITQQARRYALWELARRSGVNQELFRMWKIRQVPGGTLLETFPPTKKQTFFPNASPELLRELAGNSINTVRKGWMYEPDGDVKKLIPSFLVPFTGSREAEGPLFVAVSSDRVESSVDLLLSVLLCLSRWEESIATDHDSHGRFAAKQSEAFKKGFLDRPIVDEYGLAFEQVLKFLHPNWRPTERKLRTKVSHDADHVGIPYQGKNILRQIAHRDARNTWRELWGWLPECEPADLRAVRQIVTVTREHKLDSAVYWMASPPSARDSGYDPRHQKIRRVIGWLKEQGVECGVQPGYSTFRSPERLRREINLLREIFGDEQLGGRQHYLRWCVDTWIHWEMCGLAYDSTLSYADHIGFRAGTCFPYRPWLLSLNRKADLLEIPLLVMDRTLLGYMKLSEEASVDVVRTCVERCRRVGGVFTMVWHNNALLEPKYRSLYLELLKVLECAEPLDWKRECVSSTDMATWKPTCAIGS